MVTTKGSTLQAVIKGEQVFIRCPVCGNLALLNRAKAGKGRAFMFCPKCCTQVMTHSDVGEAAIMQVIKKATKKGGTK